MAKIVGWRRHTLLGLAALATVACNDGATDTTDTNDTSDTNDTGTTNTYVDPFWFQAVYFFGYHNDAGESIDEFVSYQANANGTPVVQDLAVVLILLEDDAGSLGDEVCSIMVTQAGPVAPTALNDVAVKKGFVFDWDTATIEHDCDGLLDPAKWGADFPEGLKSVAWGVGLTGTVDATTRTEWLAEVEDSTQWDGHMSGARPYFGTTGTIKSSTREYYFARATEVDTTTDPPTAQFNDVNDNGAWEQGESGIYLSGADIAAAPASGAYLISSPYVLNFDRSLDEVLIAQ